MVDANTCNLLLCSFIGEMPSRRKLPRLGSVLYWSNLLTLPIKAPYGTKDFGTQCVVKTARCAPSAEMATGRAYTHAGSAQVCLDS